MTGYDALPPPEEIQRAPELASLAALDTLLDLVGRVLLARYPELDDPERPYWLSHPLLPLVSDLVALSQALQGRIADYRVALHPQDDCDPDDELPL